MWFRRFIAWVRTFFSASLLDDDPHQSEAHGGDFDTTMPLIEPEFTRRQFFYPRDSFKTYGVGGPHDAYTLEPTSYESPKTVPLMRLSPQVELRHEEPTQPLPVASEPPAPIREPSQPVISEPLAANLQRLSSLPDSLDTFDLIDDVDDTTRRLLFLRRLVRQRVYNEGFAIGDTPQQYRHSLGLAEEPGEPDSQN